MHTLMYRFLYICLLGLSLVQPLKPAPLKVGIIVPAQHPAMKAIVEGIQESLRDQNVTLDIQNAQGDTILQQTIIQRMIAKKFDILMPLGTATALMTLALAPKTPTIAVAASFETHPDVKKAAHNLTVINDEISCRPVLKLLHKQIPKLTEIGILYTNSEKNIPDIEKAKAFCATNNLKIHLRKVDSIQEVLQFTPTLAKQVQVLLVLKDHLVVSAISTVIAETQRAGCLLFVMDDGSVRQGAPVGLGILEKDIGRAAGKALAEGISKGLPPGVREIPLRSLRLFLNSKTFPQQALLKKKSLEKFSQAEGISIDYVARQELQK